MKSGRTVYASMAGRKRTLPFAVAHVSDLVTSGLKDRPRKKNDIIIKTLELFFHISVLFF